MTGNPTLSATTFNEAGRVIAGQAMTVQADVPLAGERRRFYSAPMGIEQLKAELRAASPEAQEELFTLLGVLRRSSDPARQRRLAEKLDNQAGWVSEEDAARRLGLPNENR